VKGRTAERVLEALICRSLVELGSTQLEAADTVIAWSGHDRDVERHAEVNRAIWREARIPAASK
jgi:hypothetical protein